MIAHAKLRSILGFWLLLMLISGTIGCSSTPTNDKLGFNEIQLTSDPVTANTQQDTHLIVKITNQKFAKQMEEIKLQIYSQNSSLLPLIDMTKKGDSYVANYRFTEAGTYKVTVHMSFEEDHYAFTKPLKVIS